jgi:hypothetical protein
MMPPTMTRPPINSAFGSPFEAFTNCARPMVPAAPPLLSNCTLDTSLPLCIAAASARPVWSQPPPGLAGIIIFSCGCAIAALDTASAAIAARILFFIGVPRCVGSLSYVLGDNRPP